MKNQNNDNILKPALYIISLPIGNKKDITLRALETLEKIDILYCEDTRVTYQLLQYYNIQNKQLKVYNDFSTPVVRKIIAEEIIAGKSIGIVSDAGTPLISDPGFKLVKFLNDFEIEIITVPGVCSVIAALTISTLPTDKFYFFGFLSEKIGELTTQLEYILSLKTTVIAFETAKRLIKTLNKINQIAPDIEISVVKELTKLYEQNILGTAAQILNYFELNNDKLCGEIILIINSRDFKKELDMNAVKAKIHEMTTNYYDKAQIIDYLKTSYNIVRNDAYDLILEVKKELE